MTTDEQRKEMSDTDTPMTDAATMDLHGKRLATGGWYVTADFARALERENRLFRSILEECVRFIDPMDDPFGSLDKARAALAGENDQADSRPPNQ